MSQLLTSELISRLAYGEVSNLKMGDLNTGLIREENMPGVLMQLNKAMKDLFTRFELKTREVLINTQLDISYYYLRYEFAMSNVGSAQPVLYIDDSMCEDFDGRIAKILAVYDAFGRQLYLNKTQEPLSVFTPQYDCLQIGSNQQTEQFYVIFQALHPVLTAPFGTGANQGDPDVVINVPPALEDVLVLLCASKIYEGINGPANAARSALLHQKYEMALMQSEIRDSISVSANMSNSKLDKAGFI